MIPSLDSYFSNGIVISCLHVEVAQVPPRNTPYHISSSLSLLAGDSCEDHNTTPCIIKANIVLASLTHNLLVN